MQDIIVRCLPMKYSEDGDIIRLFRYIAGKGNNTDREVILEIGTRGLSRDPETAAMQVIRMQERLNRNKKRRILHIVISFDKECNNPEGIKKYASDVADCFADRYQLIYAIHTSTDNIHIHFAINRLRYSDGLKMHWSNADFNKITNALKILAKKHYLHYRRGETIEELLEDI